ncbi:GNAT family N-acetyltransferase [Streptomyces lydicus]|uniref:GNAT family N-acetyltransferase n=1 Tax=Streptomyces lydicus TaxID=47763 RepID=UPI0010107CC7|nr:GNAT family N-acetyltransferase [Streptomyces lydicus]MCZ1012267.1 GNAT family N-acetyltransferase [Streptomyces lydicus]
MSFPGPARLQGLSLYLAGWKGDPLHRWPGRQVIAEVQGRAAGHVEYYLHPDGLAVEVVQLEVSPGFRRLGLAGLLMDRLHEVHPRAWVNHGYRSHAGAEWWDQYRDPAPERNIHNRPPAEWSRYFRAPRVAANRVVNRERNKWLELDGHRAAEHCYGERLEEEYERYAPAFEPATGAPRADPSQQSLCAGQVVVLPPELHRFVHDPAHPAAERAQALLEHIGHGNLPRSSDYTGFWNTTAQAALDDSWAAQLFQKVPLASPATHLVYQAHPLEANPQPLPRHVAGFDWVDYTCPEDVSVNLAGLSWRSDTDLSAVHHDVFDSPVLAAIAPESPQDASAQYRARYDERGMRYRPPSSSTASWPFEDQRDEIKARAEKIIRDVTERSAPAAPPRRAATDAHQPRPLGPSTPVPRNPGQRP